MPVKIRSKKSGFRRCGVAHPAEWVEHSDAAFTPDQLEILRADPMLQVEITLGGPDTRIRALEAQEAPEAPPAPEKPMKKKA